MTLQSGGRRSTLNGSSSGEERREGKRGGPARAHVECEGRGVRRPPRTRAGAREKTNNACESAWRASGGEGERRIRAGLTAFATMVWPFRPMTATARTNLTRIFMIMVFILSFVCRFREVEVEDGWFDIEFNIFEFQPTILYCTVL